MRYQRILSRLPIVALGLIASVRAASGQVRGVQNEALVLASVNAAALEPPRRLSLGVGLAGNSEDWFLGASVGIGRGALYALVDRLAYYRHERRGFNVGYAQLLGAHPFAPSFGARVGVDVSGGLARTTVDLSGTAYAARIRLPVALRWGAPTGASLTSYVAPYGEIGRTPQFHSDCSVPSIPLCRVQSISSMGTSALGAGGGLRLSVWRMGLDYGVRELFNHRPTARNNGATLTLTFRF